MHQREARHLLLMYCYIRDPGSLVKDLLLCQNLLRHLLIYHTGYPLLHHRQIPSAQLVYNSLTRHCPLSIIICLHILSIIVIDYNNMIIMTLKFIETHDACIFKHTSQRKLKPINTCNLRKIQVIKPIYSDKMIPHQ